MNMKESNVRFPMTLANKITISRILFIPVIVIGLLDHHTLWVYILLTLTFVSDLLDGIVARARGERTKLGAFLDPMADKLLLTSIYLTLTYLGTIPVWIFIVIFSRDLLIVLGWAVIFILTGSATIQPRILGKVTTFLQMGAALAIMLGLPGNFQQILLRLTIAATIVSAIDYVITGEKKLGGV